MESEQSQQSQQTAQTKKFQKIQKTGFSILVNKTFEPSKMSQVLFDSPQIKKNEKSQVWRDYTFYSCLDHIFKFLIPSKESFDLDQTLEPFNGESCFFNITEEKGRLDLNTLAEMLQVNISIFVVDRDEKSQELNLSISHARFQTQNLDSPHVAIASWRVDKKLWLFAPIVSNTICSKRFEISWKDLKDSGKMVLSCHYTKDSPEEKVKEKVKEKVPEKEEISDLDLQIQIETAKLNLLVLQQQQQALKGKSRVRE